MNVDVFVDNIEISSKHDCFSSLVETSQVLEEINVPLLRSIVDPFQVFASVWHVNSHQEEFFELERQSSALLRVLRYREVVANLERLDLGEDSDTRVASLRLTAVPVLLILWRYLAGERCLNLFRVCLGLVEAQDVRVGLLQIFLKLALVERRIETIDVPAVYGNLVVDCDEVLVLGLAVRRAWQIF